MREDKITLAPVAEYEAPVLTPIGDLHDVLAGTTQKLQCDSNTHDNSSGDGNTSMPVC